MYPYVTKYCFRAGNRASWPDFGRSLVGKASTTAFRPPGGPIGIKAANHPSVLKKVDYARLVTELWGISIRDDNEEDQIFKKTIAN